MAKCFKLVVLTLVSLLIFTSFALLADNTTSTEIIQGLEAKGPGSPAETQDIFIRESDRMGMRDVLYSQIPDTGTSNTYACQLDSVYPLDVDICDDIIPDGPGWRIDSVTTWWWNWTAFVSWDSVPNIHFMVYKDSAAASPHPVDSPFIDIIVPQSHYTATAFDTINMKFRVDMVLPVSVELPADTIYWIEVQLATLFSVNGQTGWIAAPGCGNGTGFYHRSPQIAMPEWVSADSQHFDSIEVAMVLRGGYISGISEDIEGSLESLFLSVDQLTELGHALISYSIDKSGPTTLIIYDIVGKKVRTLVNRENETPGRKTVYWNYKNDNNELVANGVYFLRLESDNKTAKQKMFLLR